jgi:hypothetical protein
VRARLLTKSMDELAELARKVVAQFGDEDLAKVLERLGAHGVAGDLKNLTFAADGPKPRIVLRDAISRIWDVRSWLSANVTGGTSGLPAAYRDAAGQIDRDGSRS